MSLLTKDIKSNEIQVYNMLLLLKYKNGPEICIIVPLISFFQMLPVEEGRSEVVG